MKYNLVGEIGCNHLGRMDLAKEHISTFAGVGAKFLKFQKRTIKNLLTVEEYNAPHPNPEFSHGGTYGEHREKLELNMKQHKELFDECTRNNVIYSCSAWDMQAAKDLVDNLPDITMIKVPSASNLNFNMISYILNNSGADLHISLGMTTKDEINRIIKYLTGMKAQDRTILYACTSGYPVEFEDLCLKEISYLIELTDSKFLGYGFSNHGLGIAMDIAAATLGANWIERHVTVCRSRIRHTDAAASLEPDGFRRLNRDLNALEKALTYKTKNLIVEEVQKKKLKRNV